MDAAEKYRRQLLEQSQYIYYDTPISEATASAYLATPRHLFVTSYREWGSKQWHRVHEENLQEHVAALYANRPLILFGEDDDNIPSTISQPSFVLRMLDLLRLSPGHKVFELGAGSGWNAALMARLVGPEGHVYSLEIISSRGRRSVFAVLKAWKNGSVVLRNERMPSVRQTTPSFPLPPHQKGVRETSWCRSSLHSGNASTVIGSKLSMEYLPLSWTNPQGIDSSDAK